MNMGFGNSFFEKIVKDKCLSHVCKKACDSIFWMSLMGVKKTFLNLNSHKILGWITILWKPNNQRCITEDTETSKGCRCTKHNIPLNVSFRRALVSNKLLEWNHLVARV
jgi:hypothetical protein